MFKSIVKSIKRICSAPTEEDVVNELIDIDIAIEKGEKILALLHQEYDETISFYEGKLEEFTKSNDTDIIDSRSYLERRVALLDSQHSLRVSTQTKKVVRARNAYNELLKGLDYDLKIISDSQRNEASITLRKAHQEKLLSSDMLVKAADQFEHFKQFKKLGSNDEVLIYWVKKINKKK